MRIVNIDDMPQWGNSTKTVQHMTELLGQRVDFLSQVVKLRKDLSMGILLDGLRNVFVKDAKGSFEETTAMVFKWRIEIMRIPTVLIVEDCLDEGIGGTPITLILEKNYYGKNDTIMLEDRSLLFVKAQPEKLGPNRFRYICEFVTGDLTRGVNVRWTARGKRTLFHSNYHPELSSRGNAKYMYNMEEHVNYMSRHRASDSWSHDFSTIYLEMKTEKGKEYFYMQKPELRLVEQFLWERENNIVLGRSNHDATGKCTQTENGMPIAMGDGVIAQFERYVDKFFYSVFDTRLFYDALEVVIDKTGKVKGNQIVIVCNRRIYNQMMDAILQELKDLRTNGTWFFTKSGDKVKVGYDFEQYIIRGNYITFAIDKVLSEYLPNYGFGLFMDMSVDTNSSNEPRSNVSLFTLKGREMVMTTIHGIGGKDGRTNGISSSSIDGSEYHIIGYSGVAVFNPLQTTVRVWTVLV